MKISEYTLLQTAFNNSFGFMLNRIADTWIKCPDFHASPHLVEIGADRCFSEFISALEESGVRLEEATVENNVTGSR